MIAGLPASKDTRSFNNKVKRRKTCYAWRVELQPCGGGGDDGAGGDEGGGGGGGEIRKGKAKGDCLRSLSR